MMKSAAATGAKRKKDEMLISLDRADDSRRKNAVFSKKFRRAYKTKTTYDRKYILFIDCFARRQGGKWTTPENFS